MKNGHSVHLQMLGVIFASSLGLAAQAAEIEDISVIEFAIMDGSLASGPQVVRVARNQLLRLQWRSDRQVELHLHGYDRKLAVPAAGTVVMEIEATATGRYPLTLHGDGGDHHATLIYLEVHPN